VRYLALLYWDEDRRISPASPEYGTVLAAYAEVNRSFQDAGVMVGAAPLENTDTAVSVRVRKGETMVTDGPFAETKERLGGYYLLDCANLDQAVRLAAQIPAVQHGTIEVRPVMAIPPPAPE